MEINVFDKTGENYFDILGMIQLNMSREDILKTKRFSEDMVNEAFMRTIATLSMEGKSYKVSLLTIEVLTRLTENPYCHDDLIASGISQEYIDKAVDEINNVIRP